VVNSLATKYFNHICVLVAYQQFEEAEHAFHIYGTPNYMIVSIMNMVWLEDALVEFRIRGRCWDSLSPTEASCDIIALLVNHNSYDNEIEKINFFSKLVYEFFIPILMGICYLCHVTSFPP
jgi:hypothetical protein